jgi:hypothetical protein
VVRNQRHGLRETIASRRFGPCLACACLFVIVVCGTSAVLPPRPAIAAPQDETAAQSTSPALQDRSAQEQAEYNGQDFTRPQNLLQLRYEYTTAPGKTRQVTTDTIALRADKKIDLSPQWQLALRSDLLVRAKDPITSDNPDGHFLYGLGDADVQAGLIYTFNARWAAGFGDRLIAPTGPDSLGSGKWQMMPIVGVRDKLPEISPDSYFTFLVRYDVSVAGDPSRKTQQPAVRSHVEPRPSRSLVHHLLPEPGHQDQFWRSGHWSDRAIVSSVRCFGRPQADNRLGRVSRG